LCPDYTYTDSLTVTAIALPEQAVVNFLKWYKANNERIYKINFIKGGGLDTTTFYRVDFTQADKFIGELQKSGYLSDRFITNLQTYFKEADKDLATNQINDEPPLAFSADLIMHTQEDLSSKSPNWDDISKAKTTVQTLSSNKALVQLRSNYFNYDYTVSLINGKWLIDSIKPIFIK
jgi:hypothetical protein